jgi:hypothetical protein
MCAVIGSSEPKSKKPRLSCLTFSVAACAALSASLLMVRPSQAFRRARSSGVSLSRPAALNS